MVEVRVDRKRSKERTIKSFVPIALACVILTMIPAPMVHATHVAGHVAWRYTGGYWLQVDPIWEGSVNNIKFDMNGYAKRVYGPTASAYLVAYNAYGWQIKYRNIRGVMVSVGVDMLDVAYYQGLQNGYRLKNWGCYYRNFNDPYSWRGAYIFYIRR